MRPPRALVDSVLSRYRYLRRYGAVLWCLFQIWEFENPGGLICTFTWGSAQIFPYEEPPKRKESWVDFARFDLHRLCESSLNFLSAIFGIFGKFSIDIGENYFQTIIFSRPKKIREKKSNIFSDFFWKSFYFWGKFPEISKILPQKSKISENFQNFWKIRKFFKNVHWKSEQSKYVFYFFREKVLILKKIFLKRFFENHFHLYRS